MKKFRVLLVAALMVVCMISLTACFGASTQGKPGKDGNDGAPGEKVVVNYMDYLEYLWENVISEDEKTTKYGDLFSVFVVEYPNEFLKGNQGDQGIPGEGNIQNATNLAVQSSVDVEAVITRSGKDYGQAGGGVIYTLGEGSGAPGDIYNGNGYIITNYHVISRKFDGAVGLMIAQKVDVYLYGLPSVAIPGRVIGGSADHDVAIIEIVGTWTTLVGSSTKTVREIINTAPIREVSSHLLPKGSNGMRDPALGMQILAVGNALGEGMSVTDGIISVQSEIVEMGRLDKAKNALGKTIMQKFRVMRISAAINPGNSGGGVFDMNGRLVGIVQARWFMADETYDYPVDNVAYAIPLDVALRIADQIIDRAGEYVPGSGSMAAKTVTVKTRAYSFEVKGKDTVVIFDGDTMQISETVYVSKAGNGLALNTVLNTLKIDGNIYPITRVYQVDELMIEAYGATTVLFNT